MSHPDLEDLAALADGVLAVDRRDWVRTHLDSCGPCLAAYSTAVEAHAFAPPGDAPASLVELGRRAPFLSRTAPPTRTPERAWTVRPAALISAASVVVVALAVTIAIPRLTSDADLRVLRAAAQDLSTYLPEQLVLPEGESSADRVETSVLRSGSAQPSSPVSNAVRRLAARAPGSIEQRAEAALWLGIGYLALDDLTSARIQLDAALEESPERVELLNLAAIRAYRAGELALAEGLLRRALAAHPGNALSQLNLGIVLPGEGRREEAAALLRDVESRKLGALSARARLVLGEITAAR